MESPLLGNIWNPHLMLRDGADLWGPSQCVWGMVRLGHFPHPRIQIKHMLVAAVTEPETRSGTRHVVPTHIMWNADIHDGERVII